MFNIICNITVWVCMQGSNGNCINIQTQGDVKGNIIKEDQYNYVVDFSKTAKEMPWSGDYSSKIVSKDKCVRL